MNQREKKNRIEVTLKKNVIKEIYTVEVRGTGSPAANHAKLSKMRNRC